jgi:hypothetical protein
MTDPIELIRMFAFEDYNTAWPTSKAYITKHVREILDSAGIDHLFVEYHDYNPFKTPAEVLVTCVYLKRTDTSYKRLHKYDGLYLQRSPSITPGSTATHGKRGDKLPAKINHNNVSYVGDSYVWDSVIYLRREETNEQSDV